MHNEFGFLCDVMLRSSLILTGAFGMLFLMRSASAAERYWVILLSLAAAALIPCGILWAPKRTLPPISPITLIEAKWRAITPATSSPANLPILIQQQPLYPKPDASTLLALLLIGGIVVQSARLGSGLLSLHSLRRRSVPFLLPWKVQKLLGEEVLPPLLLSEELPVAALTGWLRPVIILPADAAAWPEERLTMVLCHELAHLRRGDHRIQPLLALTEALYWWHPLVRLALVRLRREREQACDDIVLNRNFPAADYAQTLVEIASRARRTAALAMASSPRIEKRLRAILTPSLRRRAASPLLVALSGVAFLGLFGIFSISRLSGEEPKPIAGDSKARQITIETRFMAIDESVYTANRLRIDAAVTKGNLSFFSDKNHSLCGMDLLSAPKVTVRDGQKCRIMIANEMIFPTACENHSNGNWTPQELKKMDVGVSVEVTPTWQEGKITISGVSRLTHFDGMIKGTTGLETPSFTTKESYFLEALNDGQTIGIPLPVKMNGKESFNENIPSNTGPRVVFLFLTAKLNHSPTEPKNKQ